MFAIAAVGSSKNMTPNRENARSWRRRQLGLLRVGAHQLDVRETELGASLARPGEHRLGDVDTEDAAGLTYSPREGDRGRAAAAPDVDRSFARER